MTNAWTEIYNNLTMLILAARWTADERGRSQLLMIAMKLQMVVDARM